MDWLSDALDRLSEPAAWAYLSKNGQATEPAALAALALGAHGRLEPMHAACRWLVERQNADGSLGPTVAEPSPGWPTGVAVLAWSLSDRTNSGDGPGPYADAIARAVEWIVSIKGQTSERNTQVGHDSMIVAWPWVDGTHSWVEPTAMHVLALKTTGRFDHPRTREGVRMLMDRLLPSGGANYGNTTVLGQVLRPHVEPTGLSMLALADEHDAGGRIAKSLSYLERELSADTTSESLGYGLMGLSAHGRLPAEAQAWLETAFERTVRRDPAGFRLALLALAALGTDGPLNPLGFPSAMNGRVHPSGETLAAWNVEQSP